MASDFPRPFWDHLDEIRSRLIKSIAAVVLGTCATYPFSRKILDYLAVPVGHLVFIEPTEAFMVHLKIALGLGVVAAMPFVLWQAWQFVAQGLYPAERKIIFWILPASYVLFVAGFAFGVLVLVPPGIAFLLSFAGDRLVAAISADAYFSFLLTFGLVLGGVFQMPLLSFILGLAGVLKSEWLSAHRRYFILGGYIFCAIVTPGPDPVTAIMLAIPTYLLYESSIQTTRIAQNIRRRAQ